MKCFTNKSVQITEYRYVRVQYESQVDWSIKTDYLRCNPKFHGEPRYDFVITNPLRGRPLFAQLVLVFTIDVGEDEYHLALIHPLDRKVRLKEKKVDKALSIHRWRVRNRDKCEVIPLDSLVRGAVLVNDPRNAGDYFAIDALDADMFLRVKGYMS